MNRLSTATFFGKSDRPKIEKKGVFKKADALLPDRRAKKDQGFMIKPDFVSKQKACSEIKTAGPFLTRRKNN